MNEQNQKSPTENNKKHNGRRLVAGLLLAGVANRGVGGGESARLQIGDDC